MLSKNLRYLRRQKGYSQDYIADYLGYKSYTTIQKWEMGVSEPPIGKLIKLSKLYQVDLNRLNTIDLESEDHNNFIPKVPVKEILTTTEERILYDFKKLNDIGQKKALDNIHDLTLVSLYRNDDTYSDSLIVNAAHEIPGSSEEDKQYDEDIMDDNNF